MPHSLLRRRHATTVATIVVTLMFASTSTHGEDHVYRLVDSEAEPNDALILSEADPQPPGEPVCDRLWTISTRHLTTNVCRANLERPPFSVFRVSSRGQSSRSDIDQYFESVGEDRSVVVYVHGNRLDASEAIGRGLAVYRCIRRYRKLGPIDWVMLSWPTEKQGMLLHDARRKAARTDAQGLYLSWVLRRHAESNIPTTLIGYSFGVRVVTGALHALAGGKLGGRIFPGPPITGIPFDAGFIAPAIESHAMTRHGSHGLATQNLDQLLVLYNRRDAVLKRYWLLNKVRGTLALGYTGPRSFAPRADGSRLHVRSRECSSSLGIRHDELDYYQKSCRAGSEMAALINDIHVNK